MRRQAKEAEILAEVLADSLPEGTLQRLIGFLIVRTAGARMGVAPLGDARNAGRLAAELDQARDTLEQAWGPGEIAHGHSVRVLAATVVEELRAAQERPTRRTLAAWLDALEAAEDIGEVAPVEAQIRQAVTLLREDGTPAEGFTGVHSDGSRS